MSYGFRLFKRDAIEDPAVTAQRDVDFRADAPDAEKEAVKRKVAAALIAGNPKLAIFSFGYEEIAEFEKCSVEEAQLKYRHLELNDMSEGSNGIQITLFDDEASVTVPSGTSAKGERNVSRNMDSFGRYQWNDGVFDLRSADRNGH